jgi:hypothetical protein
MQVVDGLGYALVVVVAGAFARAAEAFATNADLHGFFWSLVGAVSVGAVSSFARSGGSS